MAFPVSRLEAERRRRYMSQWELARVTGIIQPRLSLIERGEVKPRDKEIESIARALGKSIDDVAGYFDKGGWQTSRENHIEQRG